MGIDQMPNFETGVPNTAIQHFSIDVATVFADLSGIGTATAYLENISSRVRIYLFLPDDIVNGPTRSMHRTSFTFNARFSKVSTFFKFTCSLCKHPGHSVTYTAVSFLQPGQ